MFAGAHVSHLSHGVWEATPPQQAPENQVFPATHVQHMWGCPQERVQSQDPHAVSWGMALIHVVGKVRYYWFSVWQVRKLCSLILGSVFFHYSTPVILSLFHSFILIFGCFIFQFVNTYHVRRVELEKKQDMFADNRIIITGTSNQQQHCGGTFRIWNCIGAVREVTYSKQWKGVVRIVWTAMRVNSEGKNESFVVDVSCRHGYVMLLWLFLHVCPILLHILEIGYLYIRESPSLWTGPIRRDTIQTGTARVIGVFYKLVGPTKEDFLHVCTCMG